MYEAFNDIIETGGTIGDGPSIPWYELYWEDAYDMLKQFDENDWQQLKEELPNKSDEWKECMVFCFNDNENQHEIDIINDISNTESKKLLIRIADTIRLYFDYNKIENIDILKEKISQIKDEVDAPTQLVLNSFLKKIKQDN